MKRKRMILVLGILILLSSPASEAFEKDFLIWDPDPNHNSGPWMENALKTLGFCGDYAPVSATQLLSDYSLGEYASIFVCFGTYPYNYVFGDHPGDAKADSTLFGYLFGSYPPETAHLYMEGGDTWAFDPWMFRSVRTRFGVDTLCSEDGLNDLDIIMAMAGTCMEDLSFQYSGENQFIDRLCKWNFPDTTFYLFQNGPDSVYYTGVGMRFWTSQYITVASSFEFGGIEPSDQLALMDSIMCFFMMSTLVYPCDVSAIRVIRPLLFEVPGEPLFPQVEVKNQGNSTATFTARARIEPGGYNCSITVTNLPPGSTSLETFPCPWTPGLPCTDYDITMWVEILGDRKECNDTTTSVTRSWNAQEVFKSPYSDTLLPMINGVIAPGEWSDAESLDISDILDQAGTGPVGCNSAWMYVKNDSSSVYFAVDVNADGILEDYDTYQFFFDDNHDHLFDPSQREGRVRLPSLTTAPDTVYFQPYNPCFGPLEYKADSLSGASGFSSGNVQFELRIPLSPSGIDEVLNAKAGDTVGMWVSVGDIETPVGQNIGWWPTTAIFWQVNCPYANLLGDLVLGSAGAFRDVRTVGILSPPGDTLCPDTCYVPRGIIENVGGVEDSVDVILNISTGYVDTVRSYLSSGQTTVTFDTTCFPPDSGVYYSFVICTEMVGDVNPTNDCQGKSYYATPECWNFHDVAVVNIAFVLFRPDTCLLVGDTVYVEATIINNSLDYGETNIGVQCTAPPSGYLDTITIPFLDSMNQTVFLFPDPFIVPSSGSCYDITVALSGVLGDRDRSNDTLMEPFCKCVGVEESPGERKIPTSYSLLQSCPNPGGRRIEIQFGLPQVSEINLSVYDPAGRLVKVIEKGILQAGYHRIFWDGRNDLGDPVGSGIYFYCLTAGDFTQSRKMVVLRQYRSYKTY